MRYEIRLTRKNGRGGGVYHFENYFQAKMQFDEHVFYDWASIAKIELRDCYRNKSVISFEGGKPTTK